MIIILKYNTLTQIRWIVYVGENCVRPPEILVNLTGELKEAPTNL